MRPPPPANFVITVVGFRNIRGQLVVYSKRIAARDLANWHIDLELVPSKQLKIRLKASGESTREKGAWVSGKLKSIDFLASLK